MSLCGLPASLETPNAVQSDSSFTSHSIFMRLAKALINLRVCAGWSEPLLDAHTTVGNLMSRLKYNSRNICNFRQIDLDTFYMEIYLLYGGI